MSGLSNVGRRLHLSHGTNAARRAKRGPQDRPSAGPSAFERLEGRLLMSAVRPDASFMSQDLLVGDERSFPTTGSIGTSLGFTAPLNFFGNSYGGVFVNNNGNVTFGGRNSFFFDADFDSISSRMIAPFYADVDTRFAGSTVKYGQGTVDGHRAFAVNWVNVDYAVSSTSHPGRNSFQLVLIEREDQGFGDFDMEFNYDQVLWESGAKQGGDASGLGGNSARIGWTAFDGNANDVYQMPGSSVPGSFLNGSPTALVSGKFMSDVDGRYVYRFRGGTWADAPSGTPVNHDPVVTMPSDTQLTEAPDGTAPISVTGIFDDPDADNWTVTVDYGDGGGLETLAYDQSNIFRLEHTYNRPGLYIINLTVDDGNGGLGTGMMSVLVRDELSPVVDVLAPPVVRENESVVLTASTANDPDLNDTYSFQWLSDGVVVSDSASLSFQADDNGTRTFRLAVSDDSGNTTYRDVVVDVVNVAPTASGLSGNATLDEGGTLSVRLDGATDASPVDLAAGLTFAFDFDGDGVFELLGASPTASHVYTDNGSHVVRARVSDKDGGQSDYEMNVVVRNLAPTATLGYSGSLTEGSTITVNLASGSDPSQADLDAGLVYAFDLDGDGLFELSGTSPLASLRLDDSGRRVVRGRVSDKDGGQSDYTLALDVLNVAPVAAFSGPSQADEGQAVTFSLGGVVDPSGADTAAGFVYSFDFNNDGVFDVVGAAPGVSHVFDDNGRYTVAARVTDKDGGYSDYSMSVLVRNVAPRNGRFKDNNPTAEGQSVTVWFEGQDDPSNADTAAGFTYSFDFDGDGVYELSGRSPSATHAFGDNGVYVVHGRVTDKDGGYTEYTTDVEVYNVAPVAAYLSATGSMVEGGTVTLRLVSQTDVPADMTAGLTYSFDVNNDGVFEVTGRSPSLSRVFANDGSYTLRARVTDKDGGFSDYTTTVVVANAAPLLSGVTSSAAALGSAVEGTNVTVSGSFTDPGALDRHTAVIDWGDGTTSVATVSESNGRGSLSGVHAYAQGGVYSISVRLSDNASPAGTSAGGATAYVTGVGVQNGVLNVVGTNGADKVTLVADNKGNITVRGDVTKRNVSVNSAAVREIRVTLGAGRDTFDTQGSFSQPIYLNGVRYMPAGGKGGGGAAVASATSSVLAKNTSSVLPTNKTSSPASAKPAATNVKPLSRFGLTPHLFSNKRVA